MTTTNSPLPFIAFMVRIEHKRTEELAKLIESHGATKWLLAKEKDVKDREHIHGIVFMDDKQYDKVQRVFREKWKLNGSAQSGKTKEYGRVRKIKDRNKMLMYTVKDQNIVTSENWDIDLEKYIEASYQKGTKKELREKELKDKLIEYSKSIKITTSNIEMMDDNEFSSYQEICEQICRIYQKYNFEFPVLKTMNRLMTRYGILNVKEAIDDHLSRWFNARLKKNPLTQQPEFGSKWKQAIDHYLDVRDSQIQSQQIVDEYLEENKMSPYSIDGTY